MIVIKSVFEILSRTSPLQPNKLRKRGLLTKALTTFDDINLFMQVHRIKDDADNTIDWD